MKSDDDFHGYLLSIVLQRCFAGGGEARNVRRGGGGEDVSHGSDC